MNKIVSNIIMSVVVVLLAISAVFITYYVTIMKSEDNAKVTSITKVENEK